MAAHLFQSTRPVWGATFVTAVNSSAKVGNFNPRAPCGARLCQNRNRFVNEFISIHAPRVGRDGRDDVAIVNVSGFQSTRPVWGATDKLPDVQKKLDISIHAPRVGRDEHQPFSKYPTVEISIHAPRVGRDRIRVIFGRKGDKFQSTRPVWGATKGRARK